VGTTYTTLDDFLAGNPVIIGSGYYDPPGRSFKGFISNVRIVKGTAVYTGNFTPPTAPLLTSGTSSIYPNTANVNTTFAAANTTLLCNFTNAGIIDNAMMLNLETAGDAKISTTQSKFGGTSMFFDGTGDYIKSQPSALYDFGSGPFTIEMWIYPTVSATQQVIAFHGWSGSGAFNTGWNAQINTSNQISFYANGTQQAFTDLTVSINTWTHIAFVGTGGVLSAFKDGVKSATTLTYTSITDRPTMPVVIGGWNDNNEAIAERYFYTGYIDDLRITKGYARYTTNFTPTTTTFSGQ
jgi:hypothetical protein